MMRFAKVILLAIFAGCMPLRPVTHTDNASLESLSVSGIRAMFHPLDPTLDEIAKEILNAKSNIDIAMYSMDVTDESPVMQALASESVQSKLTSGTLRIRVIFEGYGSDEDNRSRSAALEKLGLDVRWFSGGRKVHHKFAVIDAGTSEVALITGSANWSLGSMRNYDEAILFVHSMSGLAMAFQREFNTLWGLSDEFGETRFPDVMATRDIPIESGAAAAFNTANFKITGSRMVTIEPKLWTLTRTITEAIDSAQSSIKIASTRIVLRPVYNALLRAAARGVKIEILVNQDEYAPVSIRKKKVLPECASEYAEACSTEVDFPWFLDSLEFPGKENVAVRVKFFSLNTRVTLAKQMHAKYLVVDGQRVASGSFNWSTSAEYGHIENVVSLDGAYFKDVIRQFAQNHDYAYHQGRDNYSAYISRIETAIKTGVKTDCSFAPMALTFQEIDYLLDSGQRAGGKPFKEACK
jgi:phosphatidylserine/phosphatidylglycerophosphate/cardiolipin synthase-like enzyme